MKQLSKSLFGLFLAVVVASATSVSCSDQTNGPNGTGGNTLDRYIALGTSGCTLGSLLFSNFAYSYTLGADSFYPGGPLGPGTGTPQPASSVSVAVSALNDRITFGADWIVNHYQTANLTLSFTVTASEIKVETLQSVFTAFQGGTQNGGPTSTTTALCTGGTCGPTNFTNGIIDIAPTSSPLDITNTIIMNSRGSTNASVNNYHLTIVSDQFAVTAPPATTAPTSTPEPVTPVCTGAGIAGLWLLGLCRHRLVGHINTK